MKKMSMWLMVVLLPLLLIGCGSSGGSKSNNASTSSGGTTSSFNRSTSSSSNSTSSVSFSSSQSSAKTNSMSTTSSQSASSANKATQTNTNLGNTNSRMIVYNANLSIEVKNYDQFQTMIEGDVQKDNGYIVNMSQDNQPDQLVSHLTIRVPQPDFNTLVHTIKNNSTKVIHDGISGQDVTKQYVDLDAQLKAKLVVENRLQTFMKQAKNTTDLLKISDELGNVESAIESIKGQMNYLKNQSSLSTITLVVTENKVTVPKLQTKNLNTWQKAQKAFLTSIQGITTFISWLVIFLTGAVPIIIILLIIGLISYWLWRKRRTKKEK